jgi:hypothetical protein
LAIKTGPPSAAGIQEFWIVRLTTAHSHPFSELAARASSPPMGA